MNAANFAFRVEYRSIYGAQIDSIDGLTDGDQPDHCWIVYVDGVMSQVGPSEAILQEDYGKQTALIEWKYENMSGRPAAAIARKTTPL